MKKLIKSSFLLLTLALTTSVFAQDSLYKSSNLPATMQLDRTFNFTLKNDGEQIIRQQYYNWEDLNERIVVVKGNVTVKNKSSLKFQDIYLTFRITTYNSMGHVTSASFHSEKFETTGKGEKQTLWKISEGEYFINTGDKLLIELLCNRVYEFNDNGNNGRFGGTFEIVDSSTILVEKR